MRANYHTHSDFCDGKASAAVMAEAAFKQGYRVLGFSSHAPLPFHTGWSLPKERTEEYASEIRRLAGQWSGRGLEILLGLEIDWYPGFSRPDDTRFDALRLDYRLGSVHYVRVGEAEGFTVDEGAEDFARHVEAASGGEGKPVYTTYYRALAAMIEAGGFDIVGHFDLVTKNNEGGRWFDESSPEYLRSALEAADCLSGRDLVVEVNLGGMARGKTDRPYPSLPIMRRLRELGVRITFCADAHHPSHLGVHLDAAKELAAGAGYRSVAVLSQGAWREVGLGEC